MSIRLRDLSITHAGRVLVDVPDLQLQRGRPVTLVGESGSGKSLLAHAIMGTLPANLAARGLLTFDGDNYDLSAPSNRQHLWGKRISLLPQEPMLALDPTMRTREQVAEGAAAFRKDRRGASLAADAILKALGLGSAARAFPHTLSGGMAQRVAFAAATIGEAPMLIADEPSKGLDRQARADLAGLLQRHTQAGGILLTITHDLDLARELGGDVLVMKNATIVEQGPAAQVLEEPTHVYTRKLLAAEPSSWRHAWMRETRRLNEESPLLVRGEGLAKAFGGKELFADFSVTIRCGERIALSGPSGSGKTTLGNTLLRLLPPDKGRVHHAPVLGGGRLQKLYQDPVQAFPARSTLGDGLGDLIRRHRLDPARLHDMVASLRLPPDLLTRRPGQVSGGELQRLAIIRAMLLQPVLIFADEPTSRLDLVTQEETTRALMEQVDAQDCALVLVTHDEALAETVADRTLFLGDKRPASEIKTPA